jgi:hypothetical protein
MQKNFDVCPHCLSKGQHRLLRPATPHRTPMISRSDGLSFHLFLEESFIRPISHGIGLETVDLFRYDSDFLNVRGDSTQATIRIDGDREDGVLEAHEMAADRFAKMLSHGDPLQKQYIFALRDLKLSESRQ